MVYRAPNFSLYPQTGYPPRFRRSPAKPLRIVRGGRWEVRKDPDPTMHHRRNAKLWRAYTKGNAKSYNHRFSTQAEAVAWAQYVAACYHLGGKPAMKYTEFSRYLDTRADRA